jgi:hypothetical protein
VSPDGTKIAFAGSRRRHGHLGPRLTTKAERRLSMLPNADTAPAFSPDGKSISFISSADFEQSETYIVPAEGGEPRKIMDRTFGVGYPSWSPDSRFVITPSFKPYSTRYREGMNYYNIVPSVSGASRTVVPAPDLPIGKRAGDGPAWSPDGRQIAFVTNEYLYVMPVSANGDPTGPPRQITNELTDSISWAGSNQILYMATDRLKLVDVVSRSVKDIPVNLTWQRRIATGRTVVHAGRLIDGKQATARPDIDVVIEGHRIRSVEPHRADLHTGTVVDASGASVMPGLIEGHGHQLKEDGLLFGRVHLAYGVTTVRSPGGVPYEGLEDREAMESGKRIGPRIFMTGYLLDGWRPYYPIASTAPTEAVVDMEVERARRLDYDSDQNLRAAPTPAAACDRRRTDRHPDLARDLSGRTVGQRQRRAHRRNQPARLFSEAIGHGPIVRRRHSDHREIENDDHADHRARRISGGGRVGPVNCAGSAHDAASAGVGAARGGRRRRRTWRRRHRSGCVPTNDSAFGENPDGSAAGWCSADRRRRRAAGALRRSAAHRNRRLRRSGIYTVPGAADGDGQHGKAVERRERSRND